MRLTQPRDANKCATESDGVSALRSPGRFRAAFDCANVALALIDLDGNFLEVNQALVALFGFNPSEGKKLNLRELWLPEERRLALAEFKKIAKSKKLKSIHERHYLNRSGQIFSAEVSWAQVKDARGNVLYLVASFRDMTESKRIHAILTEQASTDLLTGALNRGRVEERAAFELIRADRYREKVTLVMVDLDRFKRVNDHYGHMVGDRVLRGFCEIARGCLRATDLLGRWGGDEFVALLPGTGIHGAEQLAERLRASMEANRFEKALKVTSSMGIAFHREGDSLSNLVARADAALYRAKQTGRNRVVVDVEDLEREMSTGQRAPGLANLHELETGLGTDTAVGAEHREIFRLTNLLILVASQEKNRSLPSPLFNELVRQMETHFVAEERLLEASGYPGFSEHKGAHRSLLTRLSQQLTGSRTPEKAIELVGFEVRDDVSRHMLLQDRKYLNWLQAKSG